MPGLSSAAAAAAAASVGYYGASSIYTNQVLEQQYIYAQFLQSGMAMGGIPGYPVGPVGGFYGYGDGHAYASAGLPPPAAALSTYKPTPTILPRRIQSFANIQHESQTAYNPAAAALQNVTHNAGYYSGMLPPSAHAPARYATAASLQKAVAIKNEKVLNQEYFMANGVPKVRYRSIQSRCACPCDFSRRCSSAHAVYHHNPMSPPGKKKRKKKNKVTAKTRLFSFLTVLPVPSHQPPCVVCAATVAHNLWITLPSGVCLAFGLFKMRRRRFMCVFFILKISPSPAPSNRMRTTDPATHCGRISRAPSPAHPPADREL